MFHSDTKYMGEKSFREILEESLKSKAHSPRPEPKMEIQRPAFDEGWLNGLKPPVTQIAAKMAEVYPRQPTAKVKPTPKPKTDKVIAVALLTTSELTALPILGIAATTIFLSKSDVKSTYRSLVRQFHPDRHPAGLSRSESLKLTEKFQSIQAAYEVLEGAFARLPAKQQ
jgi:DnaJ-domain-containing protein 1